jgi:hypothetical protein
MVPQNLNGEGGGDQRVIFLYHFVRVSEAVVWRRLWQLYW